MKNIGIYIHIPFCKSKCSYCDFLSFSLNNEYIKEKYIIALKKEITNTILKLNKYRLLNEEYENIVIDTIYIGGILIFY